MTDRLDLPAAPTPPVGLPRLTGRHTRLVRLLDRWLRTPPWAQALVVMAGCMLLTAFLLDRASRFTVVDATGRTADWSYLQFIARWDSAWYRKVAQGGYPQVLPLDPLTGEVKQNPWAFYPVFPLLARALMALGLGLSLIHI